MTFKTREDKLEALRLLAELAKGCTSDAQFRIYESRRQEVLAAKVKTGDGKTND